MIQPNLLRKPEDLERKYNLSELTGLKQAVELNKTGLNKMENTISDFVTQTIGSLENLQSQIDGAISTWFYAGEPTSENEPEVNWTTDTEKQRHIGDLYYDKDTGIAYRYALDDDEYVWEKISDNDVTEALAIANKALDTADSKRQVFVVTPTPPYDVGDIWFNQSNNEMYRCQTARTEDDSYNSGDWIKATKYTDDTIANNAIAQVGELKTEVETNYVTNTTLNTATGSITARVEVVETAVGCKAQVFTSEPVVPYYVGDIWLDTYTDSSGVENTKLLVCQTEKTEGFFSREDFTLQPTYASSSELKVETDRISSTISKVEILDSDTIKNDDFNTYKQEISNQFEQTSSGFAFNFNNIQSSLDSLSGELNATTQQLRNYINFVDGNILIGTTSSDTMVIITNDGLFFAPKNTTDFSKAYLVANSSAYFESSKLQINDATIFNEIKIGSFSFKPRNNKNLSFGKLGD